MPKKKIELETVKKTVKKVSKKTAPAAPEKPRSAEKPPIAEEPPKAEEPSKKGVKAAVDVSPIVEAPAAQQKKTKKAASPKASKKTTKKKGTIPSPTIEEISLRAYYIAERRQKMGWPGDSQSDWLEAERQLLEEAREKKSSS